MVKAPKGLPCISVRFENATAALSLANVAPGGCLEDKSPLATISPLAMATREGNLMFYGASQPGFFYGT